MKSIGMPEPYSKKLKYCVVLIGVLLLAACSREESAVPKLEKNKRWYSNKQVALGEQVYEENCLGCHFERATGTSNWKKTLEDGSYPPPPLNGSAHAWHHSVEVLLTVIQLGGKSFGGKMPPFTDVLSEEEQLAVIAYFQSFWSEDVYSRWLEITQQN